MVVRGVPQRRKKLGQFYYGAFQQADPPFHSARESLRSQLTGPDGFRLCCMVCDSNSIPKRGLRATWGHHRSRLAARVWAHGGPERVGYGDLFGDRRIWLCETEGGKSNNKANILYVPSSPSHTAANAMEGEPPGAAAYATPGVDASGIKEDRMVAEEAIAHRTWGLTPPEVGTSRLPSS